MLLSAVVCVYMHIWFREGGCLQIPTGSGLFPRTPLELPSQQTQFPPYLQIRLRHWIEIGI